MNKSSEIGGQELIVISTGDLALMLGRTVKQAVHEAIVELQDRQSFAAASDWLTQAQVEEFLGRSRSYVNSRRTLRDLAKTDAEKEAAFAPSYQSKRGARVRFKRSEVEAWQRSYGR